MLLLDDDTIRLWYQLCQDDGIEGLTSFGHEGGTCRLTVAQQVSDQVEARGDSSRQVEELFWSYRVVGLQDQQVPEWSGDVVWVEFACPALRSRQRG